MEQETDNTKDGGTEIPVTIKDIKPEDMLRQMAMKQKSKKADSSGDKQDKSGTVEEEIRAKDEKIRQLEEQIKRLSAEFTNFRNRQEKNYRESVEAAKRDIISHFLPVLDSLNQACAMLPKDGNQSHTRGIEMISGQLCDTLGKLNLEEIEAEGKAFDPELHHAMMVEESDQHPEDTVLEVFQKGYRYNDRVIRPAMVKVSGKTPEENK